MLLFICLLYIGDNYYDDNQYHVNTIKIAGQNARITVIEISQCYAQYDDRLKRTQMQVLIFENSVNRMPKNIMFCLAENAGRK